MIELIIEPLTLETCPRCNRDWDLFHTLDWNHINILRCEGE